MTKNNNLYMNVSPSDLADGVIKERYGVSTVQEAVEQAKQRYAIARRGKRRIASCGPSKRCERMGCPYCDRRVALIKLVERARLEKAVKQSLRARQKELVVLSDLSDADLADELLKAAFGLPTLREVVRRRKNVYCYARRKGWKVGRECNCTGHRRTHCAVCRRSQQLALVLLFLRVCDLGLAWRTITIIPEYGRSELRKQPLGDLRKIVRRVTNTLQEHAPGITGMFVLEPCVEIELDGVENCHWHIHGAFHGIKKSEYKCIKQAFVSSDGAARAVQSKPVTDMAGHIAYILKPEYFGRKKFVRSNGKSSVQKYPIRTAQEALIATALGTKRIGARVFFINMGEVESMLG